MPKGWVGGGGDWDGMDEAFVVGGNPCCGGAMKEPFPLGITGLPVLTIDSSVSQADENG